VPPLVELLNSEDDSLVEAAARALQNLSLLDSNRAIIAREGGIGPLLSLLERGSLDAKVGHSHVAAPLLKGNAENNQIYSFVLTILSIRFLLCARISFQTIQHQLSSKGKPRVSLCTMAVLFLLRNVTLRNTLVSERMHRPVNRMNRDLFHIIIYKVGTGKTWPLKNANLLFEAFSRITNVLYVLSDGLF
jgi:hypothetical protein